MNKFHLVGGADPLLMPRRATPGSAGYDFFSPITFIVPAHGQSCLIDTGVMIELDDDKVMLCDVRSSYGFKHNVRLINTIGIIDSDYYKRGGVIKCILVNDGDDDLHVSMGDRFMQGIIVNYYIVENDSPINDSRDGGIGSTGL